MIILEQLRAVDEDAAVAVANLRASIEGRPHTDLLLAQPGLRGLLVGKLNLLCGDDLARHTFIEAALGVEGGSSKGLTHGQCAAAMNWLGEGGDKWAPRIIAAAEQAAGQIELPPAMWLEEKGEQSVEETKDERAEDSVQHWTGDADTITKFAAWATEQGLSADEVLQALDVNDVADFKGDKLDAVHRCQLAVTRKQEAEERARVVGVLAPTQREHGEATVIAFTKAYTADGLEINVTARQGATAADVALTALALVQGIQTLEELGWRTEPKERRVYVPQQTPATPQPAAPPPPAQTQAPPPPPPATQAQTSAPPPGQAPQQTGEQVLEAVRFTVGLSSSQRPQVAFYAEGHQYADLKWSFGGEKLLEASPTLSAAGWTATHFDAIGAEHALRCRVYWHESDKVSSTGRPYKDIVRVEVA